LWDDVVRNFVISHSYRSTCHSKLAIGEKGRITYCRLYLWIHSARSIVCILASISRHQASRLPCVCMPACVGWYDDFKMSTAVRKKRYKNFSTWIWPPHSISWLTSPYRYHKNRVNTAIYLLLQFAVLIKRISEATSQRKRFQKLCAEQHTKTGV